MNVIESTQAQLMQSKDRMAQLLAVTPDDRLNWQPSPSGRSILQIVAHSANALGNIALQLQGVPFAIPTSREANEQFLVRDAAYTEREEVANLLEAKCAEYVGFLATVRLEDLDRMLALPFGLGQAPLGYFMTMGNLHTLGHIAQIEYIQTLYGDHDWHTGF